MIRAGFKIFFAGSLLLMLSGVCFGYFFLKAYTRTPEFKKLAEEKVGDLLKARVAIRDIRIGFFNEVILSGIQIQSSEQDKSSYRIQVDELVFRYRLVQLLTHNLSLPAKVVFKSPRFSFEEGGFPYHFFENPSGDPGQDFGVGIKLDGGEIRFFVPGIRSFIALKELQGGIEPESGGGLRVNLRAAVHGAFSGRIQIRGPIYPSFRKHDLEIRLENIRTAETLAIPLEEVKGILRWENDNLYFDPMSAKFHGWKSEIAGRILNLSEIPRFRCQIRAGNGKAAAGLMLEADFSDQSFQGGLDLPDQTRHRLTGKIQKEGLRFTVRELKVDKQYGGKLDLDLETSYFGIDLERGKQRISMGSHLKDMTARLDLRLDHVNLFGLDLVTYSLIRLSPIGLSDKRFRWKFKGDFQTQYFILQYLPFDDFHGHFEAGPGGIKDISAFWGEVFRLQGDLSVHKTVPHGKLTLFADGFDLRNVKEFAARPLQKDLGGILEGRLCFEGDLRNPEISGNFSVSDGWVGKLKYDRGFLRCRGFPPYVPLLDSKILKGRTTLYLNGALNFSSMDLSKMFKSVDLQTADKIVIWRGWELNTSEAEGSLELNQKFVKFPTVAVKTGVGTGEASPGENPSYQDEKYVAVGPKVKF
jgi:hypothetical protein